MDNNDDDDDDDVRCQRSLVMLSVVKLELLLMMSGVGGYGEMSKSCVL